MAGASRRGPSRFFFVVLPALVLAVVVAALAGDARPAFALKSNVVWRFEIGLVIFAIGYVIGLVLYLAWQGRAPQQIGGGPATLQTTPQSVDGGTELTVKLAPPEDGGESPEQGKS